MNKSAQMNIKKGFTLVELLVVIAIIAVLAAVVVLIINPLELTRRSRDAARLTDLANLQQAINVAVQEATDSGAGILCVGTTPAGDGSYSCYGLSTDTGARSANGSGWVKVNLGSSKSVSVPTLPADPTNTPGATGYHYIYCAENDAWEINAILESAQQSDKMTTDGGDDTGKYEVGSNLELVGIVSGCTY